MQFNVLNVDPNNIKYIFIHKYTFFQVPFNDKILNRPLKTMIAKSE